ncbi:MAG: zinc-dependent metalloprotease [Candidatus Dormibacteraeota bacterium]|nr:zinc-dependent metalloprotease [Candidatus Dormibacteraeota bacterium]
MPRLPTPTLRNALAAGAMGAGAVISARALLRPRQGGEPELVDWEAVRRTAYDRAGSGPPESATESAENVAAQCDRIAAELAPLMTTVCEQPLVHFPRFVVLDRRGFIDVNIGIAKRLMVPIEELRATLPDSRATALGRGVMNRYVGMLFGIMSQRVLGQYDPVLSLGPRADGETPALYLVEPNIASFARIAGAPTEPLRRWLILHELTHAWQFGEHPWLREHLVAMMDEMIRSSLKHATGEGNGRTPDARRLLERLPDAVRTQLRGIARIQAVMSVLEGYANFVMHRVGRANLDNFDELEAAFARRRAQRTVVERAVLAITGVNMKMRQYEVGERFCDAVASAGGVALLNRVWESAAMMPSPAELRNPDQWVARARR